MGRKDPEPAQPKEKRSLCRLVQRLVHPLAHGTAHSDHSNDHNILHQKRPSPKPEKVTQDLAPPRSLFRKRTQKRKNQRGRSSTNSARKTRRPKDAPRSPDSSPLERWPSAVRTGSHLPIAEQFERRPANHRHTHPAARTLAPRGSSQGRREKYGSSNPREQDPTCNPSNRPPQSHRRAASQPFVVELKNEVVIEGAWWEFGAEGLGQVLGEFGAGGQASGRGSIMERAHPLRRNGGRGVDGESCGAKGKGEMERGRGGRFFASELAG